MYVFSRTIIQSDLVDKCEALEITIEHDADENPFHVKMGCVDHHLTDQDMGELTKAFTKAVRVRKAGPK